VQLTETNKKNSLLKLTPSIALSLNSNDSKEEVYAFEDIVDQSMFPPNFKNDKMV